MGAAPRLFLDQHSGATQFLLDFGKCSLGISQLVAKLRDRAHKDYHAGRAQPLPKGNN